MREIADVSRSRLLKVQAGKNVSGQAEMKTVEIKVTPYPRTLLHVSMDSLDFPRAENHM